MPRGVYLHSHIKPKRYDEGLVAEVRRLYGEGLTQAEVAACVCLTQRVIWRLMKRHGIAARRAAKRSQRGAANHMWKGDEASYSAMHHRLANLHGQPQRCERCGADDPSFSYDWANLSGRYGDISDYLRMCRSCHRRHDLARREEAMSA